MQKRFLFEILNHKLYSMLLFFYYLINYISVYNDIISLYLFLLFIYYQ